MTWEPTAWWTSFADFARQLSQTTFGRPGWLVLLVVPVALCMWESVRRGHRLRLPLDHSRQRRRRWLSAAVLLASFLPPLLLAVAIVILARPLQPNTPEQQRQLTNVEFVLDVSGSMEGQFGDGSKYDAAMRAIEQFTTWRKGDAFGLVIFGNEVLQWTPLTKDLSAIRSATPFLRPELLPQHFGGTEIGKAVLFSQQALRDRGEGDALIVLLSDGESADLDGSRAREIGATLAAEGMVLYAIHIGDGSPPSDLFDLSRPSGGRVFGAASPEALAAVFQHIDRMTPVKLKPSARQPVDYFRPFAIVGLFVLGAFQMSLFGLRYTPW